MFDVFRIWYKCVMALSLNADCDVINLTHFSAFCNRLMQDQSPSLTKVEVQIIQVQYNEVQVWSTVSLLFLSVATFCRLKR